jgi:hypothetical protein
VEPSARADNGTLTGSAVATYAVLRGYDVAANALVTTTGKNTAVIATARVTAAGTPVPSIPVTFTNAKRTAVARPVSRQLRQTTKRDINSSCARGSGRRVDCHGFGVGERGHAARPRPLP